MPHETAVDRLCADPRLQAVMARLYCADPRGAPGALAPAPAPASVRGVRHIPRYCARMRLHFQGNFQGETLPLQQPSEGTNRCLHRDRLSPGHPSTPTTPVTAVTPRRSPAPGLSTTFGPTMRRISCFATPTRPGGTR